jgi:hypothetical protein
MCLKLLNEGTAVQFHNVGDSEDSQYAATPDIFHHYPGKPGLGRVFTIE